MDDLQDIVLKQLRHLRHDLALMVSLNPPVSPSRKRKSGPLPEEWDDAYWALVLQASERLFPGVFAGGDGNEEAARKVAKFEKMFGAASLNPSFAIIVAQLKDMRRDLYRVQQLKQANGEESDPSWTPSPPWNQMVQGLVTRAADAVFIEGDTSNDAGAVEHAPSAFDLDSNLPTAARTSPSTNLPKSATSPAKSTPSPKRSPKHKSVHQANADTELTLSWSPTLARRASVAHAKHQEFAHSGVRSCFVLCLRHGFSQMLQLLSHVGTSQIP